jgi:hypothetical protein
MRSLLAAFAALVVVAPLSAQDGPPMPKPSKEHEWLKQFVGEWTTDGECSAGPDQPPIKMKGTDSVQAVGGFWIRSVSKGEVMGMNFEGHLTLGYDEKKKAYVATWVDNMSAHLWTYSGKIDGTGKLVMETEGPTMEDPTKMAKYRETIEFKTPDHRTFTSAIEKDGKYVVFMTMQYHRKK